MIPLAPDVSSANRSAGASGQNTKPTTKGMVLVCNGHRIDFLQSNARDPARWALALTNFTVQVPGDAAAQAAVAEAMQLGVFGPLDAHPPPQQQKPDESDDDADAEPDLEMQPTAPPISAAPLPTASSGLDVENSRKRQGERQQQSVVNGSPAKRPRLSNGYEHGVDTATTPMELDGQDHQSDNHAYPSPLEGEQVPTPLPRTDGPEQGTQVDKVEELACETTFIPLGSGLDDAPGALSRVNSDSAPVLLHCQWHPRDPSLLAAAGTDALARIWNISRGAAADPASEDHVNGIVPDFHDLVEDDIPPKATVTAMAWNWDGSAIAVATDSDSKARLTLWTPDGSHIHHFEVAEPPIIKLRWSPRSTAILAIAPDSGGTLITVYHSHTLNSLTYFLPNHDLNAEPLDAAWTSDTEFLLCGGDLLVLLRYSEKEISDMQRFETREGDTLTHVQYDSRCFLAATGGEKGFVDVSTSCLSSFLFLTSAVDMGQFWETPFDTSPLRCGNCASFPAGAVAWA